MEGIYIEEIIIQNFKCFKGKFSLKLNKGINIIVGDNESGKSTILEALHLALTGLFHGKQLRHELTEHIFNNEVVSKYLLEINNKQLDSQPNLPFILIEIFIADKNFPSFEGNGNSYGKHCCGISYKIAFDEEKYQSSYESLIKAGNIKSIPIEYYDVTWTSFARDNIISKNIPLKSAFIDSAASRYQNGSDVYISRIIKDFLDIEDIVNISQAHRKMRDDFGIDPSIMTINSKIKGGMSISSKDVKLSVDLSSKNAWENSLTTYLDNVPFHHIGKGEQSMIKTKLALGHRKAQEANVLLIEEPENHLSHAKLNQLIKSIKQSNNRKQIIISTHNSFVANKLGLDSLILLNDKKNIKINNLSDDTKQFFDKLSGYDTLRLILCKKAILVEGDSDELIVQKAFMVNNKDNCLPIEMGIDVISVGTSFLRFLEIAKKIMKHVVIVTDNDGDIEAITKKYEDYQEISTIKICYDLIVDNGSLNTSEKSFNYNTLEPKLLKANNNDVNLFNKIFSTKFKENEINGLL
ncbi:MAG: ATP-dependent nuclease, partial [Gammaproteobacteria bacterium]